jgi:ribose transport system substrate-binding protein
MSGQRVTLWTLVGIALVAAVGYRMHVDRKPPPAPPARIVFITGGSGPYWQVTANGAKAAAEAYKANLKVEMPTGDENLEQQMSILTHLDAKSLDGVAVSPLDAEGQTHLINQLVRETKVVTFDSDAPLSDRQSHVGTSNFAAGKACGRLMVEAVPQGGKVAVLIANLTKENLIDRKGGFLERVEQAGNEPEKSGSDKKAATPKYNVVGFFEDNGDDEKCAKNIKDVIAKNPDLVCFVGLNSRHGPILLHTLKDAGKLGKIKLITFDTPEETLDGIEAGNIYATIAQDPYNFGFESVKILCGLSHGEAVEIPIVGKGAVYVGAEALRKDDVPKFRERLKARQGATEAKDAGKTNHAA